MKKHKPLECVKNYVITSNIQ